MKSKCRSVHLEKKVKPLFRKKNDQTYAYRNIVERYSQHNLMHFTFHYVLRNLLQYLKKKRSIHSFELSADRVQQSELYSDLCLWKWWVTWLGNYGAKLCCWPEWTSSSCLIHIYSDWVCLVTETPVSVTQVTYPTILSLVLLDGI